MTTAPVAATGSGYPATPEGAAAIAKAFYASQDIYTDKGDAGPFLAVTTGNCPCRALIKALAGLAAAHERLVGGDTTSVAASDFQQVGSFGLITATSDSAGDNILDASGKTIRHDRARHHIVDVLHLAPTDGSWQVDKITSLSLGTV